MDVRDTAGNASAPGIVRVGPAGWSYKDWEGTVYPPHNSKFDHLAYLASYFDTIEVNSSFYRIPPPTHSTSWVRRVEPNENFRFTVKLFRGYTHEKAWPSADEGRAFRKTLDTLGSAGRLGAVLVQFPWSFKLTDESVERIKKIKEEFSEWPLSLEVRHSSFLDDDFLARVRELGLSFVNLDQPIFGDSIGATEIMAAQPAYVRFHGRNYQKWFSHEESWERYDYLYSKEELSPWVDRTRRLQQQGDVYVVTNNHFRGQAIVNAVDIKRSLGQETEVPPQLVETYGERLAV